ECFPMECLANKPAPCIGHDTPFSALFDDFITHRRSGRPIAAQEHFLSSCHTFLLPQLVVKFPEKEKHFLLHLSGGVGGVYRLCYRYDLDAEFPEFVREPYGIIVAGEAFKAINQNIRYLSPELLY